MTNAQHVPTVHNPTNFDPSHYVIETYLDNRRPRWYGGLNGYAELVADWEAELTAVFGAEWRDKVGHCCHCGNGRVRWITAARHILSGEIVVFGSDCTDRLGFENKMAFKLAILQKKGMAHDLKFRLWNKKLKFLAANPVFAAAVESWTCNPLHTGNYFAKNVLMNLDKYGTLTQRQMDSFIDSLTQDRVRVMALLTPPAPVVVVAPVVAPVVGNVPTGRVKVTGEVLTVQLRQTPFGMVNKTLLKLPNNSKVWMTVPASATGVNRGDTLTVMVTLVVAKPEDLTFAYGNRPALISHTPRPR